MEDILRVGVIVTAVAVDHAVMGVVGVNMVVEIEAAVVEHVAMEAAVDMVVEIEAVEVVATAEVVEAEGTEEVVVVGVTETDMVVAAAAGMGVMMAVMEVAVSLTIPARI